MIASPGHSKQCPGQPKTVDGLSHRLTFVYDDAGRKRVEINPLQARLTSAYDAAGRQTLRIDPRGERVSYIFDPNGKQIGRRYPDGSRVTSVYDGVGNRPGGMLARLRRAWLVGHSFFAALAHPPD